jgi:hypothetical protein
MRYKDLTEEQKIALSDEIGSIQAFIKQLKKEDYPDLFFIMTLYKNDTVFGRCIFTNREDLRSFKENYEKLTTSPNWGYMIAEVVNTEEAS